MKFGLFYLPSFDAAVHDTSSELYRQIFEQVELGESLGLESVWVAEHHFTPYGGDIPNPPLLLAALAQRTRRMRLGSAGVALPLHRAIDSVEQLAMVDALSGGRLDIGLVRGFLPFEFEALQVDQAESRARFDEAVEVLQGLWTNERFSYHGTFNHFDDVTLRPRPVQEKPRVLVGAVATPESIVSAARNGFDLMVIPYAVGPDGVRQQVQLYRNTLAECGRDPAAYRVFAGFHLYVDRDEAHAIETAREPILRYVSYVRDAVKGGGWSAGYEAYQGMVQMVEAIMDFDLLYRDRVLFGDPARVHSRIEMAAEAGIDEIGLVTILPGLPHDKILESLELFGSEVLPKYA